jgi:hypothetical protein
MAEANLIWLIGDGRTTPIMVKWGDFDFLLYTLLYSFMNEINYLTIFFYVKSNTLNI